MKHLSGAPTWFRLVLCVMWLGLHGLRTKHRRNNRYQSHPVLLASVSESTLSDQSGGPLETLAPASKNLHTSNTGILRSPLWELDEPTCAKTSLTLKLALEARRGHKFFWRPFHSSPSYSGRVCLSQLSVIAVLDTMLQGAISQRGSRCRATSQALLETWSCWPWMCEHSMCACACVLHCHQLLSIVADKTPKPRPRRSCRGQASHRLGL